MYVCAWLVRVFERLCLHLHDGVTLVRYGKISFLCSTGSPHQCRLNSDEGFWSKIGLHYSIYSKDNTCIGNDVGFFGL